MTGDDFIHRFENGAIPAESFHHADHVQLAFAYLSKYPVLEALAKFISALKQFAAAQGKSQLYNETVTFAYFFLIHERMARSRLTVWEDFRSRNSDLLIWKSGLLTRYYSEETLKSDLARTVFLFPDQCPLS